jgi:cytochrome oxidase Cu insertion factor (SCO1/SenC/PrrC family)
VQGMNSAPVTTGNSLIVSTFESSLSHQLAIVLVVLVVLVVAWNVWRGVQFRRAMAERRADPLDEARTQERPARLPEPTARRILRIGFGLIWLFDGLLQAQSSMPVGLTNQVIQPAASGSPSWVQHLVNSGVIIWNNHPIQAAVASVWIQVGIGVWLLVAPRGRWSRTGAMVSIGWGLVVWSFGEAFGAIFAPGLTILFGAPGGVVFYCIAGGLIALPERWWSRPRTGRSILLGSGIFLIGMGILQAWPGRGFWQGAVRGHQTGSLVAMVDSMSTTSQPSFLSSWVSSFGSFDASHGWGVNLFAVIALLGIGAAFCTGRRGPVRIAAWAACILCLADWVLIEDLGFLGGLGTDPNSMIPMALIFVAGYVALVQAPSTAEASTRDEETREPFGTRLRDNPGYALRSLAALAAAGVVLLGAAPMAFASTNPTASPIVTEASNGAPDVVDSPAPGFDLTDQNGRAVHLSDLRGKALAITFLDPVCTTDCPILGQEFRLADEALGSAASHTEFIAIVANPIYRSTFYTNAFDKAQGLNKLSNWLYLTGSVAELDKLWQVYGAEVTVSPAGAMVNHSDIAYVINPDGRIRYIMSADPGAATSTTKSSFAGLLDQQLTSVISS